MINLKQIPEDPGCYIYKNGQSEIIYIGKAKSLKRRVASYFSKTQKDDKTEALVKDIDSVEYFATTNEIEALILENNLIQKHKPRYNINLKDSRRYAYVIMTEEDYPRLMVARDKTLKGRYYGPFVSAEFRDLVIKLLREKFMIRTCTKLPRKECLRYHIELCTAPCIHAISLADYSHSIKRAEGFLKGNIDSLVKELRFEMKEYAQKMMYEKAKILRNQIQALEYLDEKQKVEKDKRYDEDIINYILSEDKVYLIIFNISRGILATKNEFSFDRKEDFLEEFMTQYYSTSEVPKEIILPHKLNDESIHPYLERLRGAKVTLTIPQKGDKMELLNLVRRNIEISFLQESQMTNELKDALFLNSNPNVIECFDISNISGTNIVASMVQFKNAKPDKSNYRRFKIRTVTGTDDIASIYEVVRRRYARLKDENKEMPDLIVIDGGLGQLHAAQKALHELELKLPIISLAKKFEEIYEPGKDTPLRLDRTSKALRLLQQVRDEAHRFAIKYHRLLRSKEMTRS